MSLIKYIESVKENPSKLELYDFIPVLGTLMYLDRNENKPLKLSRIGKTLLLTAWSMASATASLVAIQKGLEHLAK